jgi:S1-C subfamily serine protease
MCGAAVSYGQSTTTGTGFAVTNDGHIVTNFHVVDGTKAITVRTFDGVELAARLVKVDAAHDLAVLKVARNLPALAIGDSRQVRPGAYALTVGYPLVPVQGQEAKVTDGMVNSLSGFSGDVRLFQISVPVQPGNSGGALVGKDGSVIGIVSAKLSDLAVLARTGQMPQNVNYAIKSNYLTELLISVAGVESQLVAPRPEPFPDTQSLAEAVSRSTVLILGTREQRVSAPKPFNAAAALPRAWVELGSLPKAWRTRLSGSRIDYEYLGAGRFRFVAGPDGSVVTATYSGLATEEKPSGVMTAQYLCGDKTWPMRANFEIISITSTEIRVNVTGPTYVDCDSGRPVGSTTVRNAWVRG